MSESPGAWVFLPVLGSPVVHGPVLAADALGFLKRPLDGGATLRGDVLMMVSVGCWAAYTLGASRLIARHTPLYVTGMTMLIGTVPYVFISLRQIVPVNWGAVSGATWVSLVLSALLALNLAYLIWYIGVQRIGAARTSVYSNVVPIVAMAVAAIWLGEPISTVKIAGAAAVLSGVALTRVRSRQ